MAMGWYSVHSWTCLSILRPVPCLLLPTFLSQRTDPLRLHFSISRQLASGCVWPMTCADGRRRAGERKRQGYLSPSVPITGSFGSQVASPCIQLHPRGSLPLQFPRAAPAPEPWNSASSLYPIVPGEVGSLCWSLPLSYFTFFYLASRLFHPPGNHFSVVNSFCCGHLKWFLIVA